MNTTQAQSKLLQAESRQLFPLQCPNCQQVNSVTSKPCWDVKIRGLIARRILSNKVSANLVTFAYIFICTLAAFSFFNRASLRSFAIIPQNLLEWLAFIMTILIVAFFVWNGIRNGIVSGYKYNCLTCKYAWVQLRPNSKQTSRNLSRGAGELRQARKMGNNKELAIALHNAAVYNGQIANDWQNAVVLAQESLPIVQTSVDKRLQALCYNTLGFSMLYVGQAAQAVPLLQQSLALAQANRQWDLYPFVITSLGAALLYQGYYEPARQHFEEGLVYRLKMGGIETEGVVWDLEGLAEVGLGYGFPVRTVRLAGAASARRNAIDIPLAMTVQQHLDQLLEKARTQLGQSNFEKAWAEGLAMPLVSAVHYALSTQP
jgi:tetratricopeptide (TPR) repeat protein